MVNLTGGTGAGPREERSQPSTARIPGRFFTLHGAVVRRRSATRATRRSRPTRSRRRPEGGRPGPQDPEDARPLPARARSATGPLVKVDDPRFDPMWEACAAAKPAGLHPRRRTPRRSSCPIDRFNERYDELGHHPDWSFHGKDFPSHAEIMAARDRVFARHPKTQFLALHVGHDAENLAFVSRVARPLPQHDGRARRAHRRAGPPAARLAEVLREVPGPHPVRHRRRAAARRRRVPAAGLQGRALRDLLPLPRDRGRVLRLRAGAGAAAGPLADLRHRPARRHPEEGLPRQRACACWGCRRDRRRAALVRSSLAAPPGGRGADAALRGRREPAASARRSWPADDAAWAACRSDRLGPRALRDALPRALGRRPACSCASTPPTPRPGTP